MATVARASPRKRINSTPLPESDGEQMYRRVLEQTLSEKRGRLKKRSEPMLAALPDRR
jgi:hypothetical protein